MKNYSLLQVILVGWLLAFYSHAVFSQSDLETLINGKTNISEIMKVVDQYYSAIDTNIEDSFESEWLHWKRWEWYMSGRLGHGGEFVNISDFLLKGLEEKKAMPTSSNRNINSAWTFMGPSTSPLRNPNANYNGIGRVDRLAFHPTDPNIIYLGTPAGGLWRTTNGGTVWTNLTDHLPSIGISGIVVSHANPNHLYVLTGDGDSNLGGLVQDFGYMRPSVGVLKSIDGGLNWQESGGFPDTVGIMVGYRLIQSPADANLLIAATSDGLYRTIDGGTTWVQENPGRHYDVEFKPGDPTRVYASVRGDFWLSTDSGDTWTSNSTYNIDPMTCVTDGGRIEIAVAPSFPTKVYLLSGPAISDGVFCGVWLSTDSGASFTRQSNTPNILGNSDVGGDDGDQSFYDLSIVCRPTNSLNVFISGTTVWQSTNGGTTWSKITSYNDDGAFPYIHPDIHTVTFNPLNLWLYASTDGGFYRSQDFGATWADLSPNIETSQFYNLAGCDCDPNKLLGGLQDNGIKYRLDNTSAFHHISGADGFDIVFDEYIGEPIYSTVNRSVIKYYADGTFSDGITPIDFDAFFKTLAIHNTDPDTFFIGSWDILRSVNGGTNYYNQNNAGGWGMTSCPSNNDRFYSIGGDGYGNGDGGLFFTNDIGNTWTTKSGNAGFPDPDDWVKITDVTVHPTNSSVVWACFGGFDDGIKVVRSTNTGDTWTNMSANLPNVPINCLAIDNAGGAYAGTDIGVFYRSSSMTQWMTWSNGLPNVPITELIIYDDGTTRKIRAASFGRGVWQSNLAETCDAAIIVSGDLKGVRHYEATTSITSSSDIEGGTGTFVSFKAGSYIDLVEGFDGILNSEFLGFTGPCGQGGIPSAQDSSGINRSDANSSIILLKRMRDSETGLPYGSIDHIRINENQASIKFRIRKNSDDVQLFAAREMQDKLVQLYNGETTAGHHELNVDISDLPHEFHYLLLFYNGRLAHFQELDLRM